MWVSDGEQGTATLRWNVFLLDVKVKHFVDGLGVQIKVEVFGDLQGMTKNSNKRQTLDQSLQTRQISSTSGTCSNKTVQDKNSAVCASASNRATYLFLVVGIIQGHHCKERLDLKLQPADEAEGDGQI